MNPRAILVSTTLFRLNDAVECARSVAALRALAGLQRQQIPVILVDGGSDAEFISAAKAYGATVLAQEGATLGSARRQAISAGLCADVELLVYTEIEKDTFIGSLPTILSRCLTTQQHFIIPARLSLKSYPQFQAFSECQINQVFQDITGLPLDVAFGPRIWSREYSRYFLQAPAQGVDTWNSIFTPIIQAWKDGVQLSSVPVHYRNPPEQTAAEKNHALIRKKRELQCTQIIQQMLSTATELSLGANANEILPAQV